MGLFTLTACSSVATSDTAPLAQAKLTQSDVVHKTHIRDTQIHKSERSHVSHLAGHSDDEARPYDKMRDARRDVATALADASKYDKRALIVLGANWCHDSRALATHFETERFQTLLNRYYVVTYVDVGKKDRNTDIAKDFGLTDGIVGTPTVIITASDSRVINLETAPTWRNAASRSVDAIYNYFDDYKEP